MLGSETVDLPQVRNRNLLLLPTQEYFENILHKTLLSVAWALENKQFDFLIRTNTSTYFEDSRLRSYLSTKTDPKFFSGEFGEYLGSRFVAGNFIVLSRESCKILLQMDYLDWTEFPDDVAISKFLYGNQIQAKRLARNDLTDFQPFRLSIQHRIKSLSDPELVGQRFGELSDIYRSPWILRPIQIAIHQRAEFARYLSERPIKSLRSFFGFCRYLLQVLLVAPRNFMSH